jgi:hypothetical protein
MPGQALRFPGGSGSQISIQSSLTPQERFLVLICVRGWVDPTFYIIYKYIKYIWAQYTTLTPFVCGEQMDIWFSHAS